MVFTDVALHLKGSVGSFRDVDDKPDLTLDFNRFDFQQRFHGLRRIHLNNSVEDPSYCNEMLGSELFRAAGIPAPRVTHAIVLLNNRRLGLYVLKEGFTEDFLGCYFKRVGGNLYEPGEGHDVNERLKRNSVLAPKHNRAGLEALAEAALEADLTNRWLRLRQTLDIKEFVDFMAMEVMVGHRDGYCLARNNYRVYEDVDSGKIMFFPHGMDQLFGNPNATWLPRMAGLVAKAVMEIPEGRRLYHATFPVMTTNIFHARTLQEQIAQTVTRLRPVLTESEFASLANAADRRKERIQQRQFFLQRQLAEPEPAIVVFTNGVASLTRWSKVDAPEPSLMDQAQSPGQMAALHIMARVASGASWRTSVLLSRGQYRFEGLVKVAGVKPLPYGRYQGAGLRVAGSFRESDNLIGDSDWRRLNAEFVVTEETQEVELVCELRASSGQAWFGLDSLRLVKLP